jgi:transposase
MSQLSEITLHLPINEVEQRYKRCRDATVKSWWQTIWLRMQGKRTTEVSRIMGCRPDWVRRLVRRWNQLGSDGLEDRRKLNGRLPLLSPEQQMRLHKALTGPAEDGGLWNSPKVAKWISREIGSPVPNKRGWIYLRQLGFTSQTPRPRHAAADPVKQDEFKKNFEKSIQESAFFVPKPRSKFGHKMKHASV